MILDGSGLNSSRQSNLNFLRAYYEEKRKYQKDHTSNSAIHSDGIGSIFQKFSNQIQSKIKELGTITKEIQTFAQEALKKEPDGDSGEARFNQMKFNIPDINNRSKQERMEQTKIFCSDISRKIFTKGFKWFQQGKITEKKLRQFFCNNFLSNTIKFASFNKLNEKELKQMDAHLGKKVFSFLKQRYPQSQSEPNRKFQNIITLVDNFDSNDNDQVFQSGVKFQYKKNGDYSAEIMKFMNYLMKTTREEQSEGGNLFNVFYKQMEQIFQKVENQQWMILAKKGKFEEGEHKLNKRSSNGQHRNSMTSTDHSEIKKNDNMEEQARKQKYKKSVKQYTKYVIGQKVSDNVPLFSDKQIKEQQLNISNAGIMRIIAKWCQQLEKCFEEVNINSRDQRFRMADGSQRYIKKSQRKELYLELQEQNKRLQDFLNEVRNNIYQNQSKMLEDGLCFTAFRDFTSQDEGIAGYFATVMKKSYQNYLISYLNKQIHCILSAQQSFKAKYTRRQHYKMDATLISFKLGDLLRCKCASKEAQIIALYNYLKYYCSKHKDKLEIVRVKNRLNEGTKDILINFRFHQKLLVEMQLSIDQETSNFIKCSDKANHFIYQLQRATFGPMSQIASVYGNIDPRAQFFRKKFEEINASKPVKPPNEVQCVHQFDDTSLPVWCCQCNKYTSTLNIINKHKKCQKCKLKRCCFCVVKNGQNQKIKSKPGNLKYDDLSKPSGPLIKKKLTIIDLQKKEINQSLLFVVFFNFKVMLFEPSGQKELSLMGEAKDQKQLNKLLKNKSIINEQIVQKEQQEKYVPQIYNAIVRTMIKNVNKKMRKYFVFEEAKTDDKTFEGQKMETVQQINMNNSSLTSIDGLLKAFPNARTILIHKNKIKSLKGIQNWKQVYELNLQGNQLSSIPQEIKKLQKLDFLLITNNKFQHFPQELCQIPNLKRLNFKENKITKISQNIGKLKKLQVLRLTKNKIETIPTQIQGNTNLEQLDVSANLLTSLPTSLKKLTNMKLILFQNNKLKEIPDDIFQNMHKLRKVYLTGNQISQIPISLMNKQKLTYLDLSSNKIKIVPEFIFNLPELTELILTKNQIEQLRIKKSEDNKTKLQSIFISENKLKKIPDELYTIQTLQKIKMGGNLLEVPSQNILKLKKLKELSMEQMNLKEIPSIIFKLEKLETLSLDDNLISQIPDEIGKLKETLRELYLSNNKFTIFPVQIFDLHCLQNIGLNKNSIKVIPSDIKLISTLEKLKLEQNRIQYLPEQFFNLPHLRQLSITQTLIPSEILKKLKTVKKIKLLDSQAAKAKKKQ